MSRSSFHMLRNLCAIDMCGETMSKKQRRRLRGITWPLIHAISILLMQDSLDYLFRLAVEMKQLGLPWVS